MCFKSHIVANKIKLSGLPVISVENWTYDMDGEVSISSLVNVQVGIDYLMVGKWSDEMTEITYWPTRSSTSKICEDIREALEGSK